MHWYKDFVRDRYQCGVIVPWWKGYVVRDYARHEVVVAPLGFNVLYYFIYCAWRFVFTLPVAFDCFRQEQQRLRQQTTKQEQTHE